MTRSAAPDLEDDLRTLFAAQAAAVAVPSDPSVLPPPTPVVGTPSDGTVASRRCATAVAVTSIAATICIVIGIAALGRGGARIEVLTVDPTTSVPTIPVPTDEDQPVPSTTPGVPVVDRIESLEDFHRRLDRMVSSGGARALLGEVVVGDVTAEGPTPPGERVRTGPTSWPPTAWTGGVAAGDPAPPLGDPRRC